MDKASIPLASRGSRTSLQAGGRRVPLWLLAILSLGLLLPARAGAGDAGYHFFPKLTLLPSGVLLNLAQAQEPEQPPPQPPAPLKPERPKPERPPEALLLERGAILLPKGSLQIEPSFEYSYFSSDRIAISGLTIFDAIIIGIIEVDSLKRDILTGALTARYGLLDRLQLDVRVPVLYRRDEEVLGVGTTNQRERTTDNFGLGDQANQGRVGLGAHTHRDSLALEVGHRLDGRIILGDHQLHIPCPSRSPKPPLPAPSGPPSRVTCAGERRQSRWFPPPGN